MMNKFIVFLKKNHYSKNTIITYKNILFHYEFLIHDLRLIKRELFKYYNQPNTVWTHYNVICSYLKWTKDKRIEELKHLKLPKIPKKYMHVFPKIYLIKKTEIKVQDSQSLQQQKILIRFLFETGLRASEVAQIKKINKETIVVCGKGNKLRDIFHNYDTTIKINNFDLSTKTIRIWTKKILGQDFTPHSIRRSLATHLLIKGANPKMVMMQLGHEKIETTFRYLQLSLQDNKKNYEKFY